MERAKWFKLHSWVGVKLSLLLSFILISGTLAVVSHEIDWLTNPAMRVSPNSVTDMNWQKVYEASLDRVPDKKIVSIRAPLDPWFASEVVYLKDENQRHRLFFHPSNGDYLGDGRWYNWQRFFRMTHRHLMLPTIIGVSIVGIFAVLMLISLISSLYLYRHWWNGFFRMPRTSHRKIFWADVHRLFGVWSLWFVFVIAVTGIWYLLENWGLRADYPSRGKAVSVEVQKQAWQPDPDIFALMLKQLPEAYPQLSPILAVFPRKAGQSVQFHGTADTVLVRPRANLVSFDPISGDVITVNRGRDLSVHARISEAADPLHFGTFAGLTSKLVYFVFGVILSTLAITGTYMYGMRIAKTSKKAGNVDKLASRPSKQYWQAAISKMGWGKWFSYLALMICLTLVALVFSGADLP